MGYAVLALHDGGLPITSEAIQSLLTVTNNNTVPPFYPTLFSNFLNIPGKVDSLLFNPYMGGSGGVSSGDAGEEEEKKEEEKEEVVEEEEIDMGGGMDMFGGDDDGEGY